MKAINIKYLPQELLIEETDKIITIKYTDILSILCDKPYIQIITTKRRYLLQERLKSFCSKLPKYFQQCNKSVYVNLLRVDEMQKNKTKYELILDMLRYDISRRRVIDIKNEYIYYKTNPVNYSDICLFCTKCDNTE